MNIELPDGYRITSDPHQYVLQRRLAKPTARKSWESVSYHGRLEHAVAEFCERARRASDVRTFGELLAEERARRGRLCAALSDALAVELPEEVRCA